MTAPPFIPAGLLSVQILMSAFLTDAISFLTQLNSLPIILSGFFSQYNDMINLSERQ